MEVADRTSARIPKTTVKRPEQRKEVPGTPERSRYNVKKSQM
jgi:hypothetical protein